MSTSSNDTDLGGDEQQFYREGIAAAVELVKAAPTWAAALGLPQQSKPRDAGGDITGPDALNRAAQDRFIAAGTKLTAEEQAKRKLSGLDTWDLVLDHARDGRFPKGTDVFLMKFQGMFYVAPAQDSFMCRLRIPGGVLSSHQLRGVAELSEAFAGGYADVTTRANLQLREIGPKHTVDVLMGLHDLGIVNRGAGADNIRNVTASPTAGIDLQELIDTRPLARQMHHYILNHREMYGLPRKFNIAFDGGGRVSALEDTNDIGFTAVGVGEGCEIPNGVYFRLTLGGITGHKDFARDTGVLLKPEECVPVAAAIVKVFIEHGDRTDRKKARLKYVLDAMGFDGFLKEVERHLPTGITLRRFPLDKCQARPTVQKHGHIGFHAQKQSGLYYVGVVLPVGRMTVQQMRGLADIAERFGSGTIRLTVWQNLLISDIPAACIDEAKASLRAIGLDYSTSSLRAGLVACTGNAGCKYAAANTKAHALVLANYLEHRVQLDQPINIHLTGCHHSCAQHYIGDIGLIATTIAVGEEMVEGYHLFVGGGYGAEQGIARELYRDVTASELPSLLDRVLQGYLEHRNAPGESFRQFVLRHTSDALKEVFERTAAAAA